MFEWDSLFCLNVIGFLFIIVINDFFNILFGWIENIVIFIV